MSKEAKRDECVAEMDVEGNTIRCRASRRIDGSIVLELSEPVLVDLNALADWQGMWTRHKSGMMEMSFPAGAFRLGGSHPDAFQHLIFSSE